MQSADGVSGVCHVERVVTTASAPKAGGLESFLRTIARGSCRSNIPIQRLWAGCAGVL
jgi:hypothetical protein